MPRDWQNLFAITRFRYVKVLFHIFLNKILRYIEVRGSTVWQEYFWDAVASFIGLTAFHSRYQYLLYGTEESVYIIDMRREFNSHRIVLVHQHDRILGDLTRGLNVNGINDFQYQS